MHAIADWLYWFTGTSGTGSQYGFWSGFGSDLGEAAIIGGIVAAYRKHNCHAHKCWRLAKHPVEGTPFIVCRKHHPTVPSGDVTADHIRRSHAAAKMV